jgi:hypothetical protein
MGLFESIVGFIIAIPKIWGMIQSIRKSVEESARLAKESRLAAAKEAYKSAKTAQEQEDAFKDVIGNS